MKILRGLWLWGVILSVGCAGAASVREPVPASMTPTAAPSPTPAGLPALEEAIGKGDWASARAAYEASGKPVLPTRLLNAIMAHGLRLAMEARRAGRSAQARRHIEEAIALVQQGCGCFDPDGHLKPEAIPEGLREDLYLALDWERDTDARDPLRGWAIERLAQRHGLSKEDIEDAPIAVCDFPGRIFVIAGFWIADLEGDLQREAPGLDQLQEGERIPRLYDVFCDEEGQRIQWVNVSGGGRGVSIEAQWDGRDFRLADLSRIDLAAQTYEEVRKHIEAGELEEALKAYESGFTNDVERDPQLATLALRRGLEVARVRGEAGDASGALRVLYAALSIAAFPYDLDPETFLPRGWDRRPRSLDQWKTEAFFRDALDPVLYRDALTEYAAWLARNRRLPEAERILRGLLVLAPDYAPPYLYLGDVLWDQGKQEEARRFYQQYRERAPDVPLPPRVQERLP